MAAARWRRAATWPRTIHSGLVAAIDMVTRRDPSLLGAVAYWGFDIGALWACFQAFGHAPPAAVVVVGYYIGTLGNALPLPGGIGGVEGGMIGAFRGLRCQGLACDARGPGLPHDLVLAGGDGVLRGPHRSRFGLRTPSRAA